MAGDSPPGPRQARGHLQRKPAGPAPGLQKSRSRFPKRRGWRSHGPPAPEPTEGRREKQSVGHRGAGPLATALLHTHTPPLRVPSWTGHSPLVCVCGDMTSAGDCPHRLWSVMHLQTRHLARAAGGETPASYSSTRLTPRRTRDTGNECEEGHRLRAPQPAPLQPLLAGSLPRGRRVLVGEAG